MSIPDLPSNEQTIGVLAGRLCPYCGAPTKYIDSIEVYKTRSYGMLYACLPCGAWVGVHHKTSADALGRLANKELRQWKMRAHEAFDSLWRLSNRKRRRQNAYGWLANELGITRDRCHIGMFNVEQCKAVVAICAKLREAVSK